MVNARGNFKNQGRPTMKTIQIYPSKPNKVQDTNFVNVKPFGPSNGEKIRKRTHFPTWWENLSNYFSQFCNSTSIHGIKYVGERGRFMIEKLIWVIILTTVFYFCISLIFKTYNKWVTSPVIITFATTETSISQIPFPAITICPEVRYDPKIFNYTKVLLKKVMGDSIEEKEERYFESLSLICDGLGQIVVNEFFDDQHLTVSDDIVRGLLEVFPAIDPYNVTTLRWLEKKKDFRKVLSGTFTSEGFCYSFNMLEFDEILLRAEKYVTNQSLTDTKPRGWSLEGGYPDNDKMDTFPRRTLISGIRGGFLFDMYTNSRHLEYLCGQSLQGFKVTLHHPSELPNMDKHFRVPLDQAVYVGIKPRMITVSEALRSYKPENRKCYFDHERRLKYYKNYTQNNCLYECLSNYTSMECGCSAFYMPKDNTIPICGPGSQECLKKSRVSYLSNQDYDTKNSSRNTKRSACACLPSCSSLEYDVEISQTDWMWRDASEAFNRLSVNNLTIGYKMAHLSKLAVFYKEMQFMTAERNELYGYVDFFSNTGGLLGLFIGLSVTSLIEILYFLTLRLVCNFRKFGRAFLSEEP